MAPADWSTDLASAPDCAARLPLVVALGEAAVLPTAQAVMTAQGPVAGVPGRGADHAGAGAEESHRRRGAGRRGHWGQRQGRAAHRRLRLGGRPYRRSPVWRRCSRRPSASVDGSGAGRARSWPRSTTTLPRRRCWPRSGSGPPGLRGAMVQAIERRPSRARRGGAGGVRGGAQSRRQGFGADGRPGARSCRRRSADTGAPSEAVTALRGVLGADRPFELRARAVVALGALGSRRRARRRSPRRTRSPTIGPALPGHPRARGSEERRAGRPNPRPVLRAALEDQDPRVRETAALGLEKQGDVTAGGALITGAKQEPWPFVRRAELEALGRPVRGGRDRSR